VRRAKLYDLRDKSGKAARIKERTVRKGEKVKGSKAKAAPKATKTDDAPETAAE
jgi:hypothetical protein